MAKKDPFDPLYEDMRTILSTLYENAGRPVEETLSPEMELRLSLLESTVAKLKRDSEEELKRAGIKEPLPMPEIVRRLPQMPVTDRKAIETTLALGREIGSLYLGFLIARKEVEESKKKKGTLPNKKESVKRKAKFKKTTGDQKWKKI
jgi:hypothetical protein